VVNLKSGDFEGAPAAKKRRIDDLVVRHQSNVEELRSERSETGPTLKGTPRASDGPVLLSVADISFSVPQRKKLVLEFFEWGLRAMNVQAGNVEFGVRYTDIRRSFSKCYPKPLKDRYRSIMECLIHKSDILGMDFADTFTFVSLEHACCVPVPEKTQRQYNFCIFPPGADGLSEGPNTTDDNAIVFTISDGPPKTASGQEMECREGVTYKSLLVSYINRKLPPGRITEEPDEKLFASGLVQNHRKGEKAVHVKAFRGSKDG
jgi:hypothetical protein